MCPLPGTQRPCVLPPAISISSWLHDFYMITTRVGHQRIIEASHGSSCSLARPQQSPPPGRQHLKFPRRRRRKPANQPAHITTVCGGLWPAADCREPAMAACAAPDVNFCLPECSRTNSTHSTTAPPSAQATMTAIPSTYARRCYCSCAGILSMVQFVLLYGASEKLRGGLHRSLALCSAHSKGCWRQSPSTGSK